MTEILFTRHGQTEWNVAKKMQGQQDSPLTDTGLHQARLLGSYLKNESIDTIYSSPLGRAARTATIIQRELKLDGIELNPALKEIALANLEGMTFIRAKEIYPDKMEAFNLIPSKFVSFSGGENFYEAQKRVGEFVHSLVSVSGNEGKKILIVSHAIVLRLLMASIEGYSIDEYWKLREFFYPCSLSRVVYDKGHWSILEVNSLDYLK